MLKNFNVIGMERRERTISVIYNNCIGDNTISRHEVVVPILDERGCKSIKLAKEHLEQLVIALISTLVNDDLLEKGGNV